MRTYNVNFSVFVANSMIVTRIKKLKKPNRLFVDILYFSELHNVQWRYSPLLHVC